MIQSLYSILINWNLKDDSLACIDSLLAAGATPGNIIVVDNGSTDGSAQALRERFGSAVYVIESNQNLGFAGGANLGVRCALDQGAAWIFLLNNDTIVAPTLFAEFQRASATSAEFSILAPLILYYDVPDRIWYLGDRLIPTSLITYSLYRDQIDSGQLPPLVPVDFICGCGMLIERGVFDTIGLLDPSFFMYAEEVDFCWRAHAAGLRIACATRAKMWHKISVSADRDRPATRYLRIRNQILFYRRYARWYQAPTLFAFTLARALRIALGDLANHQQILIPPLVRGWADGWMGRFDYS